MSIKIYTIPLTSPWSYFILDDLSNKPSLLLVFIRSWPKLLKYEMVSSFVVLVITLYLFLKLAVFLNN